MLLYIIVALVIAQFIIDAVLEYLNSLRRSEKLPEELKGIYDEEKYRKSVLYERSNRRFSLVTGGFNLVVILLMLLLGGFALADRIAQSFAVHPVAVSVLFFGMLMLASDIINIPFQVYHTFVIEERFGFNKTTPKTFVTDKLKGWLLSLIMGGGLLALVTWFYLLTTQWFWVFAWITAGVFMIFMNMFYSTLIVPLFNKQTPLEEGELKEEISEMSGKTGFQLDNVFVIDGSKRSAKSNAYFAGLGKKKRIVLFDTLLNDLKNNEIVAVLTHEIGHFKKKHIKTGLAISLLTTGFTLWLLSLFIDNPNLSAALGAEEPSFHMGLLAFSILYTPVSTVLGLLTNILSRKNEYEADRFAAEHHNPGDLAEALKKLSSKNLSNLTPHPVYVFFNYSHPPLLERLRALKESGAN